MHIYFSGIGGAGIGPLALVAMQAGYEVSGSDKQDSSYITYLKSQGITNIHIGQEAEHIQQAHTNHPIDWFVYSSALPLENPNHPELIFCKDNNIKMTKRDELLTQILHDKNLKLIAIAGTHGKTTTTAMTVWLMQQLGVTFSYLLPAKTSFAEMGAYSEGSEYFVYEADEFDRNFLSYSPELSLLTGIDWDHPDIYPTRDDYNQAFKDFVAQSKATIVWDDDAARAGLAPAEGITTLFKANPLDVTLPGRVNRENAALVIAGISSILATNEDLEEIMNRFPGVGRRFEKISDHIYSDYAHTPPKIAGALQLGHEVAGDNLVVIYEGLHNTRQHFIKDDLTTMFDTVKHLYVVPSYLAREDAALALLSPQDLILLMNENIQTKATATGLDNRLAEDIKRCVNNGDTVLCLTAGGGGSLDEWLRKTFTT